MLSIIIMIGLSIFFSTSSCGLLLWDEADDKLRIELVNLTEWPISIVGKPNDSSVFNFNWKDSLRLNSGQSQVQFTYVAEDLDSDSNIELAVGFYDKFIIFKNDTVAQQWNGTLGYYGDSINSPFNYDSWEIVPVEDSPENIVGAVTFTITDEDLN